MSASDDRPMAMGVTVHAPQVVSARVHRALGVGTTVVSLGRRDPVLDTVRAELFVANTDLVDFVTDLVEAIDVARPGFLLEVLEGLT